MPASTATFGWARDGPIRRSGGVLQFALLDLQDVLRRALGDPALELGRRQADGRHIDGGGRELVLPARDGLRVATPVRHDGEPIGVLVHDRSLRMRPELLEALGVAAGYAVSNERAFDQAEPAEERNRALLAAIPDAIIRVRRDGTYLDVQAEDHSLLFRPPEELIGRNIRDFMPRDVLDRVFAGIERALETGSVVALEYELEIAGSRHWKETRIMPSGEDEIVSIVRDFTEQREAEAEQRRLAEEQAALRRVATLVAGNAPPDEVFQTVTEEVCRLLGLRTAVLHRFEDARTSTIVGKFGELSSPFDLGSVNELEVGWSSLQVLQTGAPARSNYDELEGKVAELRALGFRSSVGVPISVAGATWGALVVALREGEALPLETERRLEGFAELVALALSSAQARNELAASRSRIVEAGDAERRRIERNLHDGAQQRLVALSVGLRIAQKKIRTAPDEAEKQLAVVAEELSEALTDLRELAQGIHPAVLTDRGLGAAVEVLASRTPLRVTLDVEQSERLPESIEATAYYVVSEALANVVKHAQADTAAVRIAHGNGLALVEVEDNGAGGADLKSGSGLRGLRDRVECLDGRLEVASIAGRGTRVCVELPLP